MESLEERFDEKDIIVGGLLAAGLATLAYAFRGNFEDTTNTNSEFFVGTVIGMCSFGGAYVGSLLSRGIREIVRNYRGLKEGIKNN
jgi:MFS-type transporter involved in bile tolerance (Atg22 family)